MINMVSSIKLLESAQRWKEEIDKLNAETDKRLEEMKTLSEQSRREKNDRKISKTIRERTESRKS